jgi:hypothetical protein
LLEKNKKENEMLRFNIDDSSLKIKKYESDNLEQKSIIERLRIEIRELNNKASSFSLQLREYHEKLAYKENILNDMKDGQGKAEKLIKEKEGYIK